MYDGSVASVQYVCDGVFEIASPSFLGILILLIYIYIYHYSKFVLKNCKVQKVSLVFLNDEHIFTFRER